MPSVGEQLRRAREAQKLGVQEVVDLTKIRGDHLRALEAGDYSVFSAPVYIRGFVRAYARLLKLDVDQILEQLGQELADSGQIDPQLSPPEKSSIDTAMFYASKVGRGLVWPVVGGVLGVVLIVGGYMLWSRQRSADPAAGLGPGLYQAPTNSGDILPLPGPKL